MTLSSQARSIIGILFITVPLVQFGGLMLIARLRSKGAAYPALQDKYFRAGHAHAGVFVILAIIAQPLIDVANFASTVDYAVRAGFFLAPILIPAGFFLGAPSESEKPGALINLVYLGALLLALAALTLGITLTFGGSAA